MVIGDGMAGHLLDQDIPQLSSPCTLEVIDSLRLPLSFRISTFAAIYYSDFVVLKLAHFSGKTSCPGPRFACLD